MLREEIQLPTDANGFSRRRCPRCRAEFKVRNGRRASRVVAAALAARLPHLNAAEAHEPLPRHCPYCGAVAEAEAWWTDPQRRWLAARAAALRAEVRWRLLRLPLDTLGENPRPTYLPVLPVRAAPASLREEVDAMEVFALPCCGEELRLVRAWSGAVRCHWCGYVHAPFAVRDIGAELAALRDWTAART